MTGKECWQGPQQIAWRAGLWPAGRLLHTPVLKDGKLSEKPYAGGKSDTDIWQDFV